MYAFDTIIVNVFSIYNNTVLRGLTVSSPPGQPDHTPTRVGVPCVPPHSKYLPHSTSTHSLCTQNALHSPASVHTTLAGSLPVTQKSTIFYFFNTLCIYDMIEYSSVVFMFKVYNNQFPRHLLCFFDRVYDSHNHNTRKNVNNFKIKYCRTSQKGSCISVIGPKLWNNLHSDLQCSKSISRFKTHYKRTLLQRYEHLY